MVHYHKLVCLDKGNGGVRPILIGMLWTKILSHLLAQARPDLDTHSEGRQFGIGTPQGGLAMTMSIRARLQENPDHVIASLDFKNAICSIQGDHCPTLPTPATLTGNFPVLTKMYTKVSSVNFHMSYFHMFCFSPIITKK